ncbi:unnamed protein product [Aphanomyces euteiches]|uniref:Zinc/iron permease n=1 Tax=Aphanomyces euteiches TaxID=100861 RepID=A0A6G0WW08_9STRA|nr:hypothetical protein Ae201684_011022 [Aphanomyces euteiches]KAH9058751.1 hypothetical protein Ae201684P_006091 [Aphanomyces euteiches]KAH9145694.1 hypothetical protein AeRB84_010405 [Aphanomyces euteiches]
MDELSQFKLVSTAAIWLLAVAGGLLPLYVVRLNHHVTSLLNMGAAGIFLSASLVHMLPDAATNESLIAFGCSTAMCFPFAFVFFGLGFLAILIIETTAHAVQKYLATDELLPLIVNTRVDPTDPCVEVEVTHAHVHGLVDSTANPLVAFVVFAALSFHSMMEGMGIGAASTEAWNILLAILAHKSLAAMALAMELSKHEVSRTRLLCSLLLFAAMSPIGVAIGWFLVQGGGAEDGLASGICTALAGGTFLYVGAMEIIPQELHDRTNLVGKCAAVISSFAAFSMLALWV